MERLFSGVEVASALVDINFLSKRAMQSFLKNARLGPGQMEDVMTSKYLDIKLTILLNQDGRFCLIEFDVNLLSYNGIACL